MYIAIYFVYLFRISKRFFTNESCSKQSRKSFPFWSKPCHDLAHAPCLISWDLLSLSREHDRITYFGQKECQGLENQLQPPPLTRTSEEYFPSPSPPPPLLETCSCRHLHFGEEINMNIQEHTVKSLLTIPPPPPSLPFLLSTAF